MPDHATSSNPAVQAQLDRLTMLSPGRDVLGLERITVLMDRLGNPHRALPPVFHVAGTNGKGSTCAFLRAMLEAVGKSVHVYSSPHLVRFNERIRVAGRLIEDAALAPLLAEVLDCSADIAPSFFEATTAAAFLAFARTPAEACVVEVGLGGRLDATNVVETPLVCGIATIGIDHEAFLLDPSNGPDWPPLERIAWEKAGIAKTDVPLVTMGNWYPAEVRRVIADAAREVGTHVFDGWAAKSGGGNRHLVYGEGEGCYFHGPPPALPGRHQVRNAGLAIAMLRRQSKLFVSEEHMKAGVAAARWPGRLQKLGEGPLTALAPGRDIWLDGGHNIDAGLAIARFFGGVEADAANPPRPLHLITGMLANKDPAAIVAPLAGQLLSLSIVPAPGHETHAPDAFASYSNLPARSFPDVPAALAALPPEGDVLIAGSLYLAGEVLRLNGEAPA